MSNYITQLDNTFATIHRTNLALVAGSYHFADLEQYHNDSKIEDFTYPLLWLDNGSLDFTVIDNGNNVTGTGLQPAFYVLQATPLHDYTAEKANISYTFDLALQVLRYLYRMRKLPDGELFHLLRSGQINFTQMRSIGVDNAYGWRVSFPLQTSLDLNLDIANWNQGILPPEMTKP